MSFSTLYRRIVYAIRNRRIGSIALIAATVPGAAQDAYLCQVDAHDNQTRARNPARRRVSRHLEFPEVTTRDMNTPVAAKNQPPPHRLVLKRTQRYLETLRWLIYMLWRHQRIKAIVIVALVTAGRMLQASAFTGIIVYLNAMSADRSVHILGFSIHARSFDNMLLAITAASCALVIASFLIYLSIRASFFAAMMFAENAIATSMTVERAWPTWPSLSHDGLTSEQVSLVPRQRLLLFRSAGMLLRLPRHLMQAVWTIGGLIWISPEAVLLISIVAVPALAMNYLISRQVVEGERLRSQANRDLRKSIRDIYVTIADESDVSPNRMNAASDLNANAENTILKKLMATRLLSTARSEFVGNTGAAFAIASVGAYLGFRAINGSIELGSLVAFFFLLRMTVSSLTGMTVALTTYARFYSVMRNAYEYITSPIKKPKPFTGRPVLRAKAKMQWPKQVDSVKVAKGVPVAVISPAVLNRYTQYFFSHALMQKASESVRQRLNARSVRCTLAMAEAVQLTKGGLGAIEPEAMAAFIAQIPIADLAPPADVLLDALAGKLDAEPAVLARISLLNGFLAGAEFVVIDHNLLDLLDRNERRRWITAFGDRYLAITYPFNAKCFDLAGERHAIVLDHEQAVLVVKIQDAPEASQQVRDVVKQSAHHVGDGLEEDEELEDDM